MDTSMRCMSCALFSFMHRSCWNRSMEFCQLLVMTFSSNTLSSSRWPSCLAVSAAVMVALFARVWCVPWQRPWQEADLQAVHLRSTRSFRLTTMLSWSSTMAVDLLMSLTAALTSMSAGLFWHWQSMPEIDFQGLLWCVSAGVCMVGPPFSRRHDLSLWLKVVPLEFVGMGRVILLFTHWELVTRCLGEISFQWGNAYAYTCIASCLM